MPRGAYRAESLVKTAIKILVVRGDLLAGRSAQLRPVIILNRCWDRLYCTLPPITKQHHREAACNHTSDPTFVLETEALLLLITVISAVIRGAVQGGLLPPTAPAGVAAARYR